MRPVHKILVIDLSVVIGSFFLIWALSTDSVFLGPSVPSNYISSLPVVLLYTGLVAILILLGTVLLFLPRRTR
ncbi:MAG: hypothetical protein AUH25_01240 [Thaumarchaeota archaeon 13_1_40CM_38_12]|nr:MAG: hypothetical protein AUH25_01240 [Thaumarchaeota archaeon 13_1_40CM_38_12]